jgi:hypothetical protein
VDANDQLEQFVEGFSLDPEDWSQTQQSIFAKLDKSSSVTPTMSPHARSPMSAPQQSTPAVVVPPPDLTPPDSNDGTISNDPGKTFLFPSANSLI